MVKRRRANQVGINNLHYKLFKCPIVNGLLRQKNSLKIAFNFERYFVCFYIDSPYLALATCYPLIETFFFLKLTLSNDFNDRFSLLW